MDCDWNNPGAAPARHEQLAAMVSSYDYPANEVAEIVEKVRTINNDGVVVITKTGLIGLGGKASNFTDMHFRNGKCKGTVNVSKWPINKQEKALVYCSFKNNCVAIPVICGNVTKITWERKEKIEPNINPSFTEYNNVPEPSTLVLLATALMIGRKFMPR